MQAQEPCATITTEPTMSSKSDINYWTAKSLGLCTDVQTVSVTAESWVKHETVVLLLISSKVPVDIVMVWEKSNPNSLVHYLPSSNPSTFDTQISSPFCYYLLHWY